MNLCGFEMIGMYLQEKVYMYNADSHEAITCSPIIPHTTPFTLLLTRDSGIIKEALPWV